MGTATNDQCMPYNGFASNPLTNSNVCVLVGHSIEAITSAVVLASLGQRVHLYADMDLLAQQIQQYSFEHHLQALWQIYVQQRVITSQALPDSVETLIQYYETANHDDSHVVSQSIHSDDQNKVALYWLFLDSIKSAWTEDGWIRAFNQSHQQALPVIMSGIKELGAVSALSERLQRAWVYYIPFVFLQDGDAYN